MPIKKLSPLLINQIAAGEVIERPASVVKELVENSLDSGATRIDVAVEQGGAQLVRISDNGSGIPPEELALAVSPHATSKLDSPEKLAAISTLGFRGEALASIASISRLRIASRSTVDGVTADEGAVIEVSGDEVGEIQPTAASPGTVIEVRDLFLNTPARRKFLRSPSAEFGQISEIVQRLAMVHHSVSFSLTHNERKTLDVAAVTERRQRCVALLGKELDEALLEFEETEKPRTEALDFDAPTVEASCATPTAVKRSRVWGLAGLPEIARATSKFQYICLNGRFIRDRSLAHAIKESYRGLMPPDRHPVAVVFIEVDPSQVDVNVHPAKAEVRFREPSRMHGLILGAIRRRLLGADLTPSVLIPSIDAKAGLGGATEAINESNALRPWEIGTASATPSPGQATEATDATVNESGIGTGRAGDFANARAAFASPGSTGAGNSAGSSSPQTNSESVQQFVDYFRKMAPTQKGFVYQEVRKAMQQEPELVNEGVGASSEAGINDADELDARALAMSSLHGDVPPVLRSFGVLQVHKSYLVTEDDNGIIIIDQHALHERVMFEQLRQRILAGNLESQRLLMPVTIPANAAQQAQLESLAPLLEKIGLEAEPIGPEAIGIHAFPTFLFDRKVKPDEFLADLIDQADDGRLDASNPTALEAALHEVLDMMSCKAAVKAGDALSAQELAALLEKRQEIERASNCPHGRPTTIRLTLHDLEKQFKRT